MTNINLETELREKSKELTEQLKKSPYFSNLTEYMKKKDDTN